MRGHGSGSREDKGDMVSNDEGNPRNSRESWSLTGDRGGANVEKLVLAVGSVSRVGSGNMAFTDEGNPRHSLGFGSRIGDRGGVVDLPPPDCNMMARCAPAVDILPVDLIFCFNI